MRQHVPTQAEAIAGAPQEHWRWWHYLMAAIRPRHRRSEVLDGLLHQARSIHGAVTSHSAKGETLAFLLVGLEASGTPYTLHAAPGVGYVLKSGPKAEGGGQVQTPSANTPPPPR